MESISLAHESDRGLILGAKVHIEHCRFIISTNDIKNIFNDRFGIHLSRLVPTTLHEHIDYLHEFWVWPSSAKVHDFELVRCKLYVIVSVNTLGINWALDEGFVLFLRWKIVYA